MLLLCFSLRADLGFSFSVGGFGFDEDVFQLFACADRFARLVEDCYCLR
jgi:hypothetical protein